MDPAFKNFLSDEDEKRILEAIATAEKNTSGEIRIHLHRQGKGDTYKNAVRTFKKLGMDQTALRNGVLIYIDIDKKEFAIIGDKGIHEKTGENFWKTIARILHEYFSQGKYTEGIIQAVLETGEQLKKHFPYQADDKNELPDEISYE